VFYHAAMSSSPEMIAIPKAEYLALLQKLERLEHQLQSLLRQKFGRSTENAQQLSLFNTPDVEVIEQTPASPAPTTPAKPKPPITRERILLPKSLPEVRTVIDLPEDQKIAPDGTPLVLIGEEITVKLGFTPAAFYKELIVRPKYAYPQQPDAGIRCAKLPAQLVDGSLLSPSLGAHLLVSKFADHLPLFRIAEIYQRGRIDIPRSTLSDWVIRLTAELEPLVDRLKSHLFKQPIIHVDETVLPLQSIGRLVNARAWAYVAPAANLILYDFSLDKEGQHVRSFLQPWNGRYLQADAASNYDALFLSRPNILEVGCWAHARRKFFDIAAAADRQGIRVIAHEALERIGQLFELERQFKDFSAEQRTKQRQKLAKPLVDQLKVWLDQQLNTLTPKSPTAGAICYLLKRWDVFTRYLTDGRLAIDNNAAERALREIAVGRKNWLFAGSDKGGCACTIATSLIETAKAHALDPLAYLADVLTRLPTTLNRDIDSLLPMFWKPLEVTG
jgi:transposase